MSKTRKSLIAILSVMLMLCLGLFTLVACGGSSKTLDSIKISKQPTKKAYIIGETFDPAGMEVTANYTKGDKKESKVLETKDYTVTVDAAYLDNAGKFKLPEGKTSASAKVSVKYTENKVEKTATTNVTVSKPVKELSIKTQPTKTEYFAGEMFDATGLTLHVIYIDDTEEDIVVVLNGDNANATVKPEGAIPSGTTQVEITYLGKTVTVDIELQSGVWIEGETGLFNGGKPGEANIRTDATLEDAQKNAQKFYEAQLRADFALSKLRETPDFDEEALKGVPSDRMKVNNQPVAVSAGGEVVDKLYDAICDWVASATAKTDAKNYNEANATALKEYIESDEYLEAVEEYLASEEYEAEVKRLRANGDIYLGDIKTGDEVSFVFSSTAAGTGSIAFKLASSYLCKADNWTAIIMGDVQFNKLVEVYVNGEKYDIPDSIMLLGGKSPDGSTNQALWVNWQEVELPGITFVEGRNAIELKVLSHDIVAPAQTSHKSIPNVDSMIILPDEDGENEFELETFDNENFEYNAVVEEIELVENEGAANLIISGKINMTVTKGYFEDILNSAVVIGVGKTGDNDLTKWAEVELVVNEDYTFVATSDITSLSIIEEGKAGHQLKITSNEEEVDLSAVALPEPLKIKHNTYSINEDYEIIVIGDEVSISFNSIALEAGKGDDAGKVFVILTGEYVAYTEDELKEIVLDMEGAGGRVVVGVPEVTVSTKTVEPEEPAEGEEGEPAEPTVINLFTMKFDISDTQKFPAAAAGQFYYMHAGMSKTPGNLAAADAKINGKQMLVANNCLYALSEQWGTRGVSIKSLECPAGKVMPLYPDIRVENGKVVYVINGIYNLEGDEATVKQTIGGQYIDFQNNQNAGAPNWDTVQLKEKLVEVVIDSEAKTYEAKYDVTDMGKSAYTGHYQQNAENAPADFKPGIAMNTTVYLNGKSYNIVVVPGSNEGKNFWGCVGLKIADTDQPDSPDVGTPVEPEVPGGDEGDVTPPEGNEGEGEEVTPEA